MPRTRTKPPVPLAPIDRLRHLVIADGRPQATIAAEIGWAKQQFHRALGGSVLTVPAAQKILGALRVVDPETGVLRPGRLADLD